MDTKICRFLIIFIAWVLPVTLVADNSVNNQKDFDFELEAEKVQYQDTQDSLVAAKAEAAKQQKNEIEARKKVDAAKAENARLQKVVVPQIQELKKKVLTSEANQRELQREFQSVDTTNTKLKQELTDKKEQLKKSQEMEAENKRKLAEARKEQLELIKQNEKTKAELKESQQRNRIMQKTLENPNNLKLPSNKGRPLDQPAKKVTPSDG